ncbi:MAG: 30S ribosomal protein S12 methylthiotransferase RimO [Lachnospiraceae bacterium]|jgi:ribosomal protein S12 methylthiotransferase
MKHTIYFISLGCDKNLVDSEYMLGILQQRGYTLVDDETQAEVIVINTCGFIKDAQEESVETILEMAKLKDAGTCQALIVTGCLAQRFQDDIVREIPEVDAVIGTGSFSKVADAADEALAGHRSSLFDSPDKERPADVDRVLTTGGFSSYLKIADGCDKHCTYCIIPTLRGNYRSYPEDFLLRQAKTLAKQGVKELNIVAQETTVYGMDLYGRKMLPDLLEKLCAIDGIEWIRVLYCYPEEITPELIEVIRRQPKICHYLDMPIQHASDRILRQMGRKTTGAQIRETVEALRKAIPDIALRTTLITGFPGETQADHEILLRFVKEMRFDRLGVFTYSPEDGTPAAAMADQIDEDVKEARRDELMLAQQQIAFEKADSRVGQVLSVFVEGRVPEDDVYVGRTYMDAPDVDGYIFFEADEELISGDIVRVRVTGARDYDLIGDVVNGSE